eukprot:scaffold20423_cov73-Isochrysis_galbana.AAC.1
MSASHPDPSRPDPSHPDSSRPNMSTPHPHSSLPIPSAPPFPGATPPPCSPLLSCPARVAVMFSGGIDSLILARLADLHTPSCEPIDLLNVAFGVDAGVAPDRLTGWAGLDELRAVAPAREWRFVEVSQQSQPIAFLGSGWLTGLRVGVGWV